MKRVSRCLFLILLLPWLAFGNLMLPTQDQEDRRAEMIAELVTANLNHNTWRNIIYFGNLPNLLYEKTIHLNFTFVVSNLAEENKDTVEQDIEEQDTEDPVPYHSNFIVIDCKNFSQLQDSLAKVTGLRYWHPLSSIVLYYHDNSQEENARIFFIFWYYKASNVIIVQYDDSKNNLLISHYNPYVSENYRLQTNAGCWMTKTINKPITTFEESFVCEGGCSNVSLHSKLRADHLGTCIGYDTHVIQCGDTESIRNTNFLEDKSRNLHGFTLRANTIQILPFLKIVERDNDSYSLEFRDGRIWTTMAKLMNFSISLTSFSKSVMKQTFNLEVNIQMFYTFAIKQADLLLFPIYQIDYIIAEVDYTVAYKESGLCIISHRAGYETILFDFKLLQDNFEIAIKFSLCFFLIWCLFIIFSCTEKNRFTLDQVGKDMINTIRNVLSLTLHKPPKRETFRVFLIISLWCFFVINFATQAAIISFFTTYKRGKEIETFDDILEKNYPLEGFASPDSLLPETEERFRKMNSKIVPIRNLFECVDRMINDSKRFCIVDCSVGQFLARDRINKRGEQYLHIARERIHSNYLNMLLHRHSPLTRRFNKFMRILIEAGLIQKWEDFRFVATDIEVPVKALTMEDLNGIFQCLCLLIAVSSSVFVFEVSIDIFSRIKRYLSMKYRSCRRMRETRRIFLLEKKRGQIKQVENSTQTA